MALLKTLVDVYDLNENLAGVVKHGQPVLLPLSHSTFNAQIEVAIDGEGNFISSKKLEKGFDVVTIIPVTEDSASRSSGIAPHPLCDKLCYLAGDYSRYTGDKKEKYYESYMNHLRDWADSEYSHPMVAAIQKYLERGCLIQDLVRDKTLELDGDRLTDSIKIHGLGQTGANVRFTVYGNDIPQVWQNRELYERYSSYYEKKGGEISLCYLSGEIEPCTDKHPSKIRGSGDKAKLISGNDESGFTYRGRFTSKDEAVSLGYEASQKAHNALKWLIQKQGYTRDDSTIVCFMANRDMKLPNMMRDSVNAYEGVEEFDFDLNSIFLNAPESGKKNDTGKIFAKQFNLAVMGYAGKIKQDDRVAVIALDAATTGRLSVVYYDEMGGTQYIKALLYWQEHCKWKRFIPIAGAEGERKGLLCEASPSPRDMALAAFGTQRTTGLDGDSKLIKASVYRLLPCITKNVKIPEDMIRSAARRSSMPQSMNEKVWFNQVLCVTCAMIRFNYEKGGKTMEHFLEENLDNRSVLFGRLLAVYDFLEQRAMFGYDENGKVKEQRATNAKRYWNAYSSRPAKTLKTIKQNLISYEKKLRDYELKKFEEWTGEIMIHLADKGFDNRPLSELYLPGYYLQMEYMKSELQNFKTKENEQ